MRGKKEQKCLDFVKTHLKHENYHGFSKFEIEKFRKCLESAQANPQSNSFPDFVFENGFIEHFQITSGKVTRKGSKHLELFNKYQNENRETLYSNINNKDFSPIYFTMNYPNHSYKYLENSFRKSWESHILSANKYSGKKQIGIFMIEYQDSCIEMRENIFAESKENICYGNIRKPIIIENYSLCHDKNILNFINTYCENIKYVIYVFDKGIEVINVCNIPELIKLLPWDFCIAGAIGKIRVDTFIPIQNFEEDKND